MQREVSSGEMMKVLRKYEEKVQGLQAEQLC
jgi:hypothetical protein